ncbi:MAG: ribose 5-phosphate isomerase B [Bacteroidetes bacterium]|nr:ribose 5-phosphate isomerase B [Bacteroidota bacterium]MDA1119701.1 ribose 5-phosphate isomerase B [Bacteroidota bacterium]
MKKVAIGGDHAGFQSKQNLIDHLKTQEIEVFDFGTYSEVSTDYADYAHPLSSAVEKGEYEIGILVCGSGNGVCMTANKHQGIRAALSWTEELATLARQHNNANIICIPARFVSDDLAKKMVDIFLSTGFEGGRHERRVNKISC